MNNIFLTQMLGEKPKSSWVIDKLDALAARLFPSIRIQSTWRGMASLEFRINLFHLLYTSLRENINGEVVEIGCNAGESSVVIEKILEDFQSDKKFYVFDSFEGVPETGTNDLNVYKKGDMIAPLEKFMNNFEKLNLKSPIVIKGWFNETLTKHLPEKISFAMLDADLYSSTLLALEEVYPRLSKNSVCLLAVYWDEKIQFKGTTRMTYKSPGVKKSCDEFLADKPEKISLLVSGNYTSGFFIKS